MTLAGLQLSIHVNTLNEANGTLEIWLWVTYFHPFVSICVISQRTLEDKKVQISIWTVSRPFLEALPLSVIGSWMQIDSWMILVDCKRSLTARKINSRWERSQLWCPIYVQFTPPSTSLNSFSTFFNIFQPLFHPTIRCLEDLLGRAADSNLWALECASNQRRWPQSARGWYFGWSKY